MGIRTAREFVEVVVKFSEIGGRDRSVENGSPVRSLEEHLGRWMDVIKCQDFRTSVSAAQGSGQSVGSNGGNSLRLGRRVNGLNTSKTSESLYVANDISIPIHPRTTLLSHRAVVMCVVVVIECLDFGRRSVHPQIHLDHLQRPGLVEQAIGACDLYCCLMKTLGTDVDGRQHLPVGEQIE